MFQLGPPLGLMNHIPVCQPCCSLLMSSVSLQTLKEHQKYQVCARPIHGLLLKIRLYGRCPLGHLEEKVISFCPQKETFLYFSFGRPLGSFPTLAVIDTCTCFRHTQLRFVAHRMLLYSCFTAFVRNNDCGFPLVLSGNQMNQQFLFPLVTLCRGSQSAPGVLEGTLRATARTAVPGCSKEMCIACTLWGSVVGKLNWGLFGISQPQYELAWMLHTQCLLPVNQNVFYLLLSLL